MSDYFTLIHFQTTLVIPSTSPVLSGTMQATVNLIINGVSYVLVSRPVSLGQTTLDITGDVQVRPGCLTLSALECPLTAIACISDIVMLN